MDADEKEDNFALVKKLCRWERELSLSVHESMKFLPRIGTWDELRALHVDPLGRDTYHRLDSPSRPGT